MTKKLITALLVIAMVLGLAFVGGCESDTQAEQDSIRQQINTVTVNITNSNGSISQVNLTKQGVGYVGPRGEYYDQLPTEDQLRPVYGF